MGTAMTACAGSGQFAGKTDDGEAFVGTNTNSTTDWYSGSFQLSGNRGTYCSGHYAYNKDGKTGQATLKCAYGDTGTITFQTNNGVTGTGEGMIGNRHFTLVF
jgi:hypothetical protein